MTVATFDHKVPRSKGGSDAIENGVAAHRDCNNRRADVEFELYCEELGIDPVSGAPHYKESS